MKTPLVVISTLLISATMLGCGGHTDCITQSVLTVGPVSGTANHTAKAPGDTVQFQAGMGEQAVRNDSACAVPQIIAMVQPNWTVSDSSKATISSAKDATNGLAKCLASSSTPIIVTASATGTTATGANGTITATATLTCK